MTTEISIVPAVTFLLPLVAGAVVLSWRRIDLRLQQGLPILSAALVTANVCAFGRVPGLLVVDWAA